MVRPGGLLISVGIGYSSILVACQYLLVSKEDEDLLLIAQVRTSGGIQRKRTEPQRKSWNFVRGSRTVAIATLRGLEKLGCRQPLKKTRATFDVRQQGLCQEFHECQYLADV